MEKRIDKYEKLKKQNTDGANYDLGTEDIIKQLTVWDEIYGIDICNVEQDTVTVEFKNLPEDLRSLAQEIYEFCPDTIDQHFGLFGDIVDGTEDMNQSISDDMRELVRGIDFNDENYGFELLQRSLKKDKFVVLWWD